MEVIIGLAGVGVGALLIYLILKGKTTNAAKQQAYIDELTAKLNQLSTEADVLAERNRHASETISVLQATLAQRDEERIALT